MTDDDRTPIIRMPNAAIADRLDGLARALGGAGIRIARLGGLVESAEPSDVARSLAEIETQLADLGELAHRARRACKDLRLRGIVTL